MPAADGADASNGGPHFDLEAQKIEMGVRQIESTGPQQQVAITADESQEQPRHAGAAGPEIHEERQPPETQQQDQAASGGGSGSNNQEVGQGSSSQPPEQPARAIIPKVRERLRRVDSDLFTPQAVLIGPYHRTKDFCSFSRTEEEKTKAVHGLVDNNLAPLMQVLDTLEVRQCYTHLPNDDNDEDYMDPEAFTNMLLHDGCYLLTFFINLTQPRGTPPNQTRDTTLVRDTLYLLENQIPLSVLETILDHIRVGEARTALHSISLPVKELLQKQRYISKWTQPASGYKSPSDLLHLVYSYFQLPPHKKPTEEADQPGDELERPLTGRWRRTTDYCRYGDLRFKRRKFKDGEEWTILDIHLKGGTLYIPFLRVGSTTWTMLRNLMALEEEEEKRPVTAYCYFMSQVACTAEDVSLLVRAKILEHFLGSDEQAAKGFEELCDGMALDIDRLDRNYLKPKWHAMERRCRKKANYFKGFFRQKYCSNVFYQLAFLIAFVVFVGQMAQSIYAVVAYYSTPK